MEGCFALLDVLEWSELGTSANTLPWDHSVQVPSLGMKLAL